MYVIKNQNKQKEWHPATKPLQFQRIKNSFKKKENTYSRQARDLKKGQLL
jgi:hypothetical protein